MKSHPLRLVSVALTFVTALTLSAQQPAPRVPPGVKATFDVPYVESGHARQVLDLYVPESGQSHPLIVWVHGGGWRGGDKRGCPPLRLGFAERGYAIASVNYRLSQDAIYPAQLEDCKTAIRWLRAHAKEYNLDADHIGVWGSSAGGHLVALLGTTGDVKEFDAGPYGEFSSRVQCVIDDFGPTDFNQLAAIRLAGRKGPPSGDENSPSQLIGGSILDPANRDKVARANPVAFVTKDDPPFLIEHGDKDPLVPHQQSELLFDALKQAGVPVRLNTVKGGVHGGGFGGDQLEKMRRDFLDYHLRGVKTGAEQWPAAMVSSTDAIPFQARAAAK